MNRKNLVSRCVKLFNKEKFDFYFKFTSEVPDSIADKVIYIVGKNGNYWVLLFYCPCGCGQRIYLNLLEETEPVWKFSLKRGLISVSPSIWRNTGCNSHFNVKKGIVDWVRKKC